MKNEHGWELTTMVNPEGKKSDLYLSPDGTEYTVFKNGPVHHVNRMKPAKGESK